MKAHLSMCTSPCACTQRDLASIPDDGTLNPNSAPPNAHSMDLVPTDRTASKTFHLHHNDTGSQLGLQHFLELHLGRPNTRKG